jgi:hypothetical protein
MKTTAPPVIPPAMIRRLEKLLTLQGSNALEFLKNAVQELETNHKDPAWQASFMDRKRSDADMAASKSPRDFLRRVRKWAPAAWQARQSKKS